MCIEISPWRGNDARKGHGGRMAKNQSSPSLWLTKWIGHGKNSQLVVDQIGCVDKTRLIDKLGTMDSTTYIGFRKVIL